MFVVGFELNRCQGEAIYLSPGFPNAGTLYNSVNFVNNVNFV